MNTYASKASKAIPAKASGQGRQQAVAQLVDNRPATLAQASLQTAINESPRVKQLRAVQEQLDGSSQRSLIPVQRKENHTGLPDHLKAGAENLSGLSLDGVRVHYNSAEPAQLQAHAYAQGSDIHIGPGQEKHLPHEAWHVVQQRQGRVKPTKQLKSKAVINDNPALEREADVMGAKSVGSNQLENTSMAANSITPVAQLSEMGWREKLASELGRKRGGGGKKGSEDDQPKDLAAEEKKKKIAPYLALLDHLAGECTEVKTNATITGGHLLTAMQGKWGNKLKLVNPTTAPTGGAVWALEWALVAHPEAQGSAQKQTKTKGSTMFPAGWTKDTLRQELEGASTVGSHLSLASGIIVKKTGDTFYPDPSDTA